MEKIQIAVFIGYIYKGTHLLLEKIQSKEYINVKFSKYHKNKFFFSNIPSLVFF